MKRIRIVHTTKFQEPIGERVGAASRDGKARRG